MVINMNDKQHKVCYQCDTEGCNPDIKKKCGFFCSSCICPYCFEAGK